MRLHEQSLKFRHEPADMKDEYIEDGESAINATSALLRLYIDISLEARHKA